jgi:uncharacterized membrane protein
VPVRLGAAGISGLSTCAGEARDASSDAGVIVGQLACAAGEPRAFVWTQSAGVRLVTDVLGDAGVSVSGWILLRANGVSDDGRIIVGEGIFDGDVRGWVAHLLSGPMCDSIDFNNDGSLFDPTDVDAFLSVFSEGSCVPSTATCNDVDFNNDGSLFDPQDIDAFLSVFSEGPCL